MSKTYRFDADYISNSRKPRKVTKSVFTTQMVLAGRDQFDPKNYSAMRFMRRKAK